MLNAETKLRACHAVGDPARFTFRGQLLEGFIQRTHPRRAEVRTSDGTYFIPYERLYRDPAISAQRERKLQEIDQTALQLLKTHGLPAWTFGFDHSTRRAGCCNYRARAISISIHLAMQASGDEIRDTLLHEIAHALVGSRHGHDRIWRAKALEIGGSGTRTHRMEFAVPRWQVRCINSCWSHTAQRRNTRLVCRSCGGKLVYSPFSPD